MIVLQIDQKIILEKIARQKGLTVSALTRMWLMEKANETLKLTAS